jgi:alkanesulfonate monooxygenase SsuD/methylene tetrahydromethanopterin reductase-like flavin-dependent oxidoreductase (luciferase family)
MRVFYFSEQPYFPAWDEVEGVLRVMPPNRVVDPATASDLLHRYLDEWLLADDVGLNLMVNEHHSSLTCMSASVTLSASILARQTRKCRLLALGIPMTNRLDPFRVAEEVAYIDLISKGRFEFGLVKGAPEEPFSSNLNPADMMERYWEGTDLVVKALTYHDGPFIWEGRDFHYQYVNVIPRGFQDPHPNMWVPGSSPSSAKQAAARNLVFTSFLTGYNTRPSFKAYREEYSKLHNKEAPEDRLAYLAVVAVADTVDEALKRAKIVNAFRDTLVRSVPAHLGPPGYISALDHARLLASAGKINPYARLMDDGTPLPDDPTYEQLAAAGMVFWGTPDMVYDQIKKFYDGMGGFGNLIMMGQGGTLPPKDTADSITLFARHVNPRLAELKLGSR